MNIAAFSTTHISIGNGVYAIAGITYKTAGTDTLVSLECYGRPVLGKTLLTATDGVSAISVSGAAKNTVSAFNTAMALLLV
jgi:hypothetical protein